MHAVEYTHTSAYSYILSGSPQSSSQVHAAFMNVSAAVY